MAALDPKNLATFPPLKEFKASDGITIKYVDVKPAGTVKNTILWVHGFPEFWAEWRYQIPHFAKLGYRSIAPNTRGYNGNEPHAGENDIEVRNKVYSYGKAARDLKELLDHEGLKQAIIIGHDWGSLLVQRFALLYPSYVEKLVLVCIPYIPHDDTLITLDQMAAVAPIVNYQRYFNTDKAEKEINADLAGFVDIFFRKGGEDAGGIGEKLLSSVTPENGIFEYAKTLNLPKSDLLSEQDVKEYVGFYESIGGLNGPLNWYRMRDQSFPEFAGKPKELTCKTLFVGAEHDPFASGPWLEPMKAFVKDTTWKEVKNAGHWVAYEQPEELNRQIEDWLERGI